MAKPNVVCVGAGGHARALEMPGWWKMIDVRVGDTVRKELSEPVSVIVGVGAPSRGGIAARVILIDWLLGIPGLSFPSYRVDGKKLFDDGLGIQMFSRFHVGPGVSLGRFCILNTRSTVEHDATIGEFTHVAPHACVLGGAHVGSRCLIGAGAIVLPGVSIADGVVVGAGSVVTTSVGTPEATVVGSPARMVHP